MRAAFGVPCAARLRGIAAIAMAEVRNARRSMFSPFGEFIAFKQVIIRVLYTPERLQYPVI
jgi:hypothetical protein